MNAPTPPPTHTRTYTLLWLCGAGRIGLQGSEGGAEETDALTEDYFFAVVNMVGVPC